MLLHIQKTLEHAQTHEQDFMEKITTSHGKEQRRLLRSSQLELSKAQKRIAELDDVIARTFEHGITEKLSKERFEFLLEKYEAEQAELKTKAAELERLLAEASHQTTSAERFLELIQGISAPTELTRELAYKLLECVLVGKAEFIGSGHHTKRQDIRIRYNHIGELENTTMETSRWGK